jgi:hypothetical protein
MAAVVHWPMTGDFFKYDDFLHMFQIVDDGGPIFVLTPHYGHALLTRNFVFYLCWKAFGFAPAGYQWVLLLTHLLNVGLLFTVVRGFTRRAGIALFAASLWGMSPLTAHSVFWFSAHGHLLMVLGVLWVLKGLSRYQEEGARIPGRTLVGWALVTVAFSFAYGAGLAIGFGFVLIVACLLPRCGNRRALLGAFASVSILLPVLYAVTFVLYRGLTGLTEMGAGEIIMDLEPLAMVGIFVRLIAYGFLALLGGPLIADVDHVVAYGPLTGASSTVVVRIALASLTLVVPLLVWGWRRSSPLRRSQMLGFALIALATYGATSLGRTAMMEIFSVDSNWVAATPRYHYASTVGLVILLSLALSSLLARGSAAERWARRLVPVWVIASPLLFGDVLRTTYPHWGWDAKWECKQSMARVGATVRRQRQGRAVYIPNRPFLSVGRFGEKYLDFPGTAGIFAIAHPDNTLAGRRVYFVDPEALARRQGRGLPPSRIDELLVAEPPGTGTRR